MKQKVKRMEYNILNVSIRWQISASIKVILEQFSLTLTVFPDMKYCMIYRNFVTEI